VVASNETPTCDTTQAFHRLQRLFERVPGMIAVGKRIISFLRNISA
jgi:hypothetical protein